MSSLTGDHLQVLLDCNRGLYHGHVFGQCLHPVEIIHQVAQNYECLSNLTKLSYDAVCSLHWIRYYTINSQIFDTYATGEILWEQLDLVSDEILKVLDEFLPSVAVSLQRELCQQYRSIMKMSLEEVSAYLWNIQHGEDFVVCLRRIAVETVFHPRWNDIIMYLDMVENTHQKFLDEKLKIHSSIKHKLLLQRRVEKAKRDMLSDLEGMCE